MTVNWNGKSANYNVDDDVFYIDAKNAPVGAWYTSHTYSVKASGDSIVLWTYLPQNAYQGNSYRFNIDAPTGANVTFYLDNKSAREKLVKYIYVQVTNKTIITVELGITNAGTFTYEIPGNPFNLNPNAVTQVTIPKGGSLNLNGLVCYLPGTLIRTDGGDIPVEHLQVGCLVEVWDPVNLEKKLEPITWIGKGTATPADSEPSDITHHPIRITKDAIAPNEPYQDLLVTADHCLFIDGSFVLARMLVNGATISYENIKGSYEYYHIETADHSIIWANGTKAESYLDTGNRHGFRKNGHLDLSGSKKEKSEKDSTHCFRVDEGFVRPIYDRLLERAIALNHFPTPKTHILSKDPGIFLETDLGQEIFPIRVRNGLATFMIPGSTASLWIRSRVARPCDTLGPFVDDRRQLGVLIGEISLYTSTGVIFLDQHLKDEEVTGWREFEGDAQTRWTMGRAFLDLQESLSRLPDEPCLLGIKIIAGGPYLSSEEEQKNTCLSENFSFS
ncbi:MULTISPECIES: Hint domain-containing protein [Asaia]|uniref:Hint domain-containing protein n=1 Tax=Asaia TaxID=91914 RepID=UPI0025565A7F|nr:Hint domain-containing protein [Asaia sp. HumB]MDL2171128.1 Hint domain-containing protein [Asaia sp. HumB]